MNKTLLYIGAAVIGIGAAALLFVGGGGEDDPAPPPTVSHSAGGEAKPVAELSEPGDEMNDEEAPTVTHDEGMVRQDPVEESEEEPYVSPQAEEMRKLLDAPYGQFTRVAGPAWTLMSMKLAEGGAEDLAAEARDVAMEIRRSRRDPNPDAAASAAKQRDLMARIESAGVSGTSDQLARLDELVTALEGGVTPPGFETEGAAAE